MKTIPVNNGQEINLKLTNKGLTVENFGSADLFTIPDHEIIMLLNYYRNCKSGLEKSDYILKED